jgi:hypothetical protein
LIHEVHSLAEAEFFLTLRGEPTYDSATLIFGEEKVRESWVRHLAWVLVIVFPASIVMADATSAMLNAAGSVTLNGSLVERATAIFPGDRVQTGPNSLATLTNEGSSVTVPGNSSLVFSKTFVNVLCGSAMVRTSRGMPVRVSNMLVQPARGAQTRFEVTQNERQLQIIAREGTLAIDDGGKTSSLQPGRMLTASATCMAAPYGDDNASNSPSGGGQDQGQGQPQDKNNNKKRDVPPPTAGANAGEALLIGGVAAGLGGLAVWLSTRNTSSASNVVTH